MSSPASPPDPSPTQPTPTPPPDPTPPPSPTQPTPQSQSIPKDRFDEVNRQARDAARRADEAERRLQEIEDANKTEKERAEAERDREKQRADAAEAKYAATMKKNALRGAAQTAGAIDADVIVAYVNDQGIEFDAEDDAAVAKVIADVQADKPTLFGEAAPAPRSFGVPTPGTPTPGSSDDDGDPRMALGKGLLAAINRR